MVLHQPFEISYWFVNVFSGSTDIFVLISCLVILWLCSLFRMQMGTFLLLFVVYSAILAAWGVNAILIILILILGPVLFWITRRIVE